MKRTLVLMSICAAFSGGAWAASDAASTSTTPAKQPAAKPTAAKPAAVKPAAAKAVQTPAAHAPNLPRLSAEQIVDRNVTARGGLKAWESVLNMTLSGQIGAGGKKETDLPFVMTLKRPHMSRLEIRFQDQTAVQVYDGKQGWKYRPFLGRDEVEPYTPAEARMAQGWAELDGPLVDYAAKGTRVALAGTETVEGHDAYKLKLTMKGGQERNVWIDGASFLELKIDGEPRQLDGRMRKVAVYYRDYRAENGLTVPHELETVVDGATQSHKMTIATVKFNQALDDAMFGKPVVATVGSAMH